MDPDIQIIVKTILNNPPSKEGVYWLPFFTLHTKAGSQGLNGERLREKVMLGNAIGLLEFEFPLDTMSKITLRRL